MAYQIDLDTTLEELRKLLHEYSDLAIDVSARHNLAESSHKIQELKSQVDHLKYLLEEKQNNDDANNKNFLAHHAMALRRAIDHHFLIAHQLMVAETDAKVFEEEMRELEDIHRELQRLYNQLREQQEMKQHLEQQTHVKPTPYPSPFGSHREDT